MEVEVTYEFNKRFYVTITNKETGRVIEVKSFPASILPAESFEIAFYDAEEFAEELREVLMLPKLFN